ncbi:hypothetical protein OH76DRAFT_1452640 [Lentinus brumalis]|uniref:DNA replication checkpoint mediator MRC1 domain-containing protein n=1 Tax=Lentinus brumalis TaxID=2498619 RepID=A0A371DT72_9APHY|nr:hypothetical protein OH76DRAFT_1452640 [Polyporus brumalis]
MSPESSPVIVRSRRTYGRRATSDYDSSFEAANTSVDSREDPDLSHSTSLDFDHPPSSDPPDASNASPVCEHGSDGEQPSDGNTFYKYGWRAKLKEIDEHFEEDVHERSGKSREHTMGASTTRPATPSDQDHNAGDAFGGSLSSLTNSSQPVHSVAQSPASFRGNVLPVSDYESDHDERPSTPQTSSPNPLGTPRSGSSPTPPTSIEMPPKKSKGKAKALAPLRYDSGDQSPSSSKLPEARDTKTQRKSRGLDKRAKVKRPTKKDAIETKKATVRLTAQQSAQIAPAPQKNNFSLSKLKQFLAPAVPQSTRARTPMPSTDPIEEFSSPRRVPDTPDTKPAEKPFVLTGLLEDVNADEDEDEDEEMPDIQDLLKQQARQKELKAFKKRYVEQVAQRGIDASDDDGEIEIVDDMKTVTRDEAQARRGAIARGEGLSHGSKRQLAAAGRSARREPALSIKDDTEVRRTLQAAAQPSFLGRKEDVRLSPRKLNLLLLEKAERQTMEIIQRNQEEWRRRGGKIKEQPGAHASVTNPLVSLQEALEKRRSVRDGERADPEVVHDSDGSDDEWQPDGSLAMDEYGDDDVKHSDVVDRASDFALDEVDIQADDEDDEENPFHVPRQPQRRARAAIESDDDDDDDAENHPPPQPSRGRKLVRDSTWVQGSHAPDATAQSLSNRNSISSLGDLTDGARTEDGTDKENDAYLSFDRGEDKENTVIALQSPAARLGRYGSLFASEIAASPSGSVGRGAIDEVRSPLKELPGEDDDPFAFTPGPALRLGGSSREGGGLESSPLNLGAGSGLEAAFSLSPTGKSKGKARARSTSSSPLGEGLDLGGELGGGFGGGGFSQFFTQEGNARGFDQLKAAQDDDDVALTADTRLQATLDVSSTWLKKADEIFEKEQEHIAQQEQASAQNDTEPEMFVDANGFLTQTRPPLVSPVTRTPFHLHLGVQFSSPGSVLSSVRKPLAPLLAEGPDDEDDLPARPRRLRKRTESPEPPLGNASKLNAFRILGNSRPSRPKKAKKLDKSEFIEGEAEESDEEAGFGFGLKKMQDDDEDQDGEDQDRILEELVDDKEMDERTLGEERVLEKVREHQEVDDKANEKLHLDAVHGKLRKRRRGGIDVDVSDSDEDEDARGIRGKMKKPKRAPENIEELARIPETVAFAQAYSANIADDGEEFAHLRDEDDTMDIDGDGGAGGGDEDEDEEDDGPGAVSSAHLREQLLAAARQADKQAQVFDPEDVSWADRDEEELELESRVREISAEAPTPPVPNAASGALKAKSNVIDKATPSHLLRWAKAETSTRTGGIIGRNAGSSVAVTGHGKSKGGNGSFKEPRSASTSNAAKSKPVTKQPSMLSSVPSLTKRKKFGN